MLLYLLTFLDFKMNIIFNTEVQRESTMFFWLHESLLLKASYQHLSLAVVFLNVYTDAYMNVCMKTHFTLVHIFMMC